jgi:hypothetical protein
MCEMRAIEWARAQDPKACDDALEWLEPLGDVTMEEAYQLCPRGDWLLWALERHTRWATLRLRIWPVVERIEARAIRRGVRSIRGVQEAWAVKYRLWARRWLSGEDRSAEAAELAAKSAGASAGAAEAAAWEVVWGAMGVSRASEQRRQAREIRMVIKRWPA